MWGSGLQLSHVCDNKLLCCKDCLRRENFHPLSAVSAIPLLFVCLDHAAPKPAVSGPCFCAAHFECKSTITDKKNQVDHTRGRGNSLCPSPTLISQLTN